MHIYAQNAYTYKIYTLSNLRLFVLLFFLLYIKRPLLYATTAKQGGIYIRLTYVRLAH